MALYLVHKKNPYFRMGSYVRAFDEGVQQCIIENVGNRAKIVGYKGLFLPYNTVRPFLTRVMRSGIDRGIARRENNEHFPPSAG